MHVEDGEYVLDQKLIHDFEFDEIRTENLISVYANEASPLIEVRRKINRAIKRSEQISPREMAKHRFDDHLRELEWDRRQFNRPRYHEINAQQTQTADANWYFLESKQAHTDVPVSTHIPVPLLMQQLNEMLGETP